MNIQRLMNKATVYNANNHTDTHYTVADKDRLMHILWHERCVEDCSKIII